MQAILDLIVLLFSLALVLVIVAVAIFAILALTESGQETLVSLPLPDPLKAPFASKVKQRKQQRRLIERQIDKFQQNPQDPKAAESLCQLLKANTRTLTSSKIGALVELLLTNHPNNPTYHQLLKTLAPSITYTRSYEIALQALAENPETLKLKSLALEIGRIHYGNRRPDKKLTIYDEQAIQNDLTSHSR